MLTVDRIILYDISADGGGKRRKRTTLCRKRRRNCPGGYVWEECLDPQYLDGAYLEPSSLWPSVQHLTVLFCCSRPQQEDRQEDIEEWVLIT